MATARIGDQPLVTLHRGDEVEVLFTAEDLTIPRTLVGIAARSARMIDCLQQPGLVHDLNGRSARDTLEILMAIYESSRAGAGRCACRCDVPDNPLLTMLAEGVV